jgi:hypothetical protein
MEKHMTTKSLSFTTAPSSPTHSSRISRIHSYITPSATNIKDNSYLTTNNYLPLVLAVYTVAILAIGALIALIMWKLCLKKLKRWGCLQRDGEQGVEDSSDIMKRKEKNYTNSRGLQEENGNKHNFEGYDTYGMPLCVYFIHEWRRRNLTE